MSGSKGMANNAPRVQPAGAIVDEQMRDVIDQFARWPVSRHVSLGALVAKAQALAGRCKRLDTRHDKTVAAVLREGLLVPPPGVEA